MATIVYRVRGTLDGHRVEQRFRNTDAGRAEARALAATIKDATTVYDVRGRIGGRVVTKTFPRRKDADAYAATLEADKLRGVAVDPRGARTPVAELAERWLTSSSAKRPGSIARDRAIITHHIKPALGARAIGSITRADVQALVDSWAASGAPSTVGRQYSCLRAIFAYAEADEKITRTPCRGIRLPQVQLVDRPELDADQLSELADALGTEQAPMMWLGAILGLRWAEAAGLTASRVDPLAGTITVDRQLARSRTLAPPKSAAGVRTLSAPDWLLEELAAVLAARGVNAAEDDLVFVDNGGGALDYTNWRRRVWVPACREARLPGLRFHDLRSAAATALVAAGVDVKTTQRRLGHSSPTVTLALYARATAEADRQAAKLVGERFRPRDKRAMSGPATRRSSARSGR